MPNTNKCPECGQETLRSAEELGLARAVAEKVPLGSKPAPLGLGLMTISLAGTGMLVAMLLLAGVENLYVLGAATAAGVFSGVRAALKYRTPPGRTLAPAAEGPRRLFPSGICLSCRGPQLDVRRHDRLRPELLRAGDLTEASSPERLRRLGLAGLPALIGQSLGALATMAAGGALIALGARLTASAAAVQGGAYTLAGIFGAALMCLGMGWVIWNVRKMDASTARLFRPGDFLVAECEVDSPALVYVNEFMRPLVEVRFSDFTGRKVSSLHTYLDFREHLSSRRLEEDLKPGDEHHELKGKRPRLPLRGWVLYDSKDPWSAQLAGLKFP